MSAALYRSFNSEGPIVKIDIPGNERAKRGSVRWTLRTNLVDMAHRRTVGVFGDVGDHGHELGCPADGMPHLEVPGLPDAANSRHGERVG